MQLTPTPITNPAIWNAALRDLPYAHMLQTWECGEFNHATTGWQFSGDQVQYRNTITLDLTHSEDDLLAQFPGLKTIRPR